MFLELLISFNILWFTFVSSCIDCSKLVSSSIIFPVNKLLFELPEIPCVSGTRILSGSSEIKYVLDTPLSLSCNILAITTFFQNMLKVFVSDSYISFFDVCKYLFYCFSFITYVFYVIYTFQNFVLHFI